MTPSAYSKTTTRPSSHRHRRRRRHRHRHRHSFPPSAFSRSRCPRAPPLPPLPGLESTHALVRLAELPVAAQNGKRTRLRRPEGLLQRGPHHRRPLRAGHHLHRHSESPRPRGCVRLNANLVSPARLDNRLRQLHNICHSRRLPELRLVDAGVHVLLHRGRDRHSCFGCREDVSCRGK